MLCFSIPLLGTWWGNEASFMSAVRLEYCHLFAEDEGEPIPPSAAVHCRVLLEYPQESLYKPRRRQHTLLGACSLRHRPCEEARSRARGRAEPPICAGRLSDALTRKQDSIYVARRLGEVVG